MMMSFLFMGHVFLLRGHDFKRCKKMKKDEKSVKIMKIIKIIEKPSKRGGKKHQKTRK